MAGNTFVRQGQLTAWEAAKAITFIEDAPLFSTADAPYFLSQASAVIQGEPEHALGKKRVFPNAVHTGAQEQETGFFGGHALLPITIGSLSSDAEIPSILRSGNRLIIISSALTALSIAMCFAAAGYWLKVRPSAEDYLRHFCRSSIGRIDTDQPNLGFFTFSCARYLAGRSNTTRAP